MSESHTGPTAPDQGRWSPFDQVTAPPSPTPGGGPRHDLPGTVPPATTPATTAPTSHAPTSHAPAPRGRRRPPVWLLVLAAVLVAGVTFAVVMLLNRPEAAPVPEAEVVTLPAPTPTVDPVERTPGTAFAGALPSTVVRYALASEAADPAQLAAGALEGYALTYTDGAAQIAAQAGQWATPEAAAAAYQARVAALVAASPGTTVEEGPVEVAGAEVGRFTLVPAADGTASLAWSNGTVVLQLVGPLEDVRDVFTGFSL